jgi:hypothetical protein|tara:strand:- start:10589 stop:11509 length:921 start_codon:yes stop_codon:yes gene_type:complete
MPTISDAITRTKRLLHSNTRTELNAIHTALPSAATDIIRLKHQTDGIRAGSYISVGGGTNSPETMYVHLRNGEYATVQRGIDGSTAREWEANTLIEVEPRFTEHQIHEAVKDAIRALPDSLYATAVTTASFGTTEQSVPVTDLDGTGFNQILSSTRTARSGEDRLLAFNVKVQEYAGVHELIRQESIEKTVTVKVTYAHPFVLDALTLDIDLVSTVGMTLEMTDIPALGAAASLLLGEESLRLDLHGQGVSRSDSAVAAGDRARYSMILQAQCDRRISQEARRLMAKWGVRTGAVTSSVFPTSLRG